VAVDLPGYGRAERIPPGAELPGIDRLVADLVRANSGRETSGHEKPVIVGNSLGGIAALRAAQERDLPIAGVVAISPAGLGHQPWVDVVSREPVIHQLLRTPLPLPMGLVRRSVEIAFRRLAVTNGTAVDPAVVSAYSSQYERPADVRRMIRRARELLGEIDGGCYELERIERPLLMIWGRRDPLTPVSGAQLVLDSVAGAELVVLEDCGHVAQIEATTRVADLVCAFADRTGPEKSLAE
jgi:pimeloyl-ACP methyl ester carboxylesterase